MGLIPKGNDEDQACTYSLRALDKIEWKLGDHWMRMGAELCGRNPESGLEMS